MAPDKDSIATLMLMSGELDKAIVAFEIACAMAAMGMKVNMWFVLYGVNAIKKPAGIFSCRKWCLSKNKSSGRNTATDVALQRVVKVLNHDGYSQLPLSQLNYFGLGPYILNFIMKKKGVPTLQKMIEDAHDLGVVFKICQPCIDILALDAEKDLLIKAEVLGASSYVMDVRSSHYNAVF